MLQGLKFTFKMFKKRPLRMFLTIFQIAAGVASIVIVLSFVFSVMDGEEPSQKLFSVRIGQKVERGEGSFMYSIASGFTSEMLQTFSNETNYVNGISPLGQHLSGYIEKDGEMYLARYVNGVGPGYLSLFNINMIEGNFITQVDVETQNRVVVISQKAARELFGNERAVGNKIRFIRNLDNPKGFMELEIIGVFDGLENHSFEPIHFLFPYSLTSYGMDFGVILVSFPSDRVAEGKAELEMLFEKKYKDNIVIKSRHDGDMGLLFEEMSIDTQKIRENTGRYLGLFLGSFAFVSLVVSFIGILSTMLVTIVERTREFGLRRGLGASKTDIIGQVILESVMLSFMGGVFGILLAFVLIEPLINELIVKNVTGSMVDLSAKISLYPILISVGSITLIGMIAGLYPGIQASKLTPVEAIREN